MATSGVTAFNYTRDQIINAALRKLVVLSEGSSANATQLSTGAEALNLLVMEYQTLGMPLWARKTRVIPMVADTSDYTLSSPKPLKIYQAFRNDTANPSNIDVMVTADYDFNTLPVSSRGVPVSVTYQPKVDDGVLRVWPTPDASIPTGTALTIVYQAEFEVFVAATDTLDFPQEWYNAVVLGLAVALAPEYGVPLADQANFVKLSDRSLGMVTGFGQEDGSIFLQPDRR